MALGCSAAAAAVGSGVVAALVLGLVHFSLTDLEEGGGDFEYECRLLVILLFGSPGLLLLLLLLPCLDSLEPLDSLDSLEPLESLELLRPGSLERLCPALFLRSQSSCFRMNSS